MGQMAWCSDRAGWVSLALQLNVEGVHNACTQPLQVCV